jgi:hypothetical protein
MIDAIFIIFSLSLFVGVCIQWRAIRLLKMQFTDKWKSLGRPNLINNSIPTVYKLHKFVWKKQYIDLKDPDLFRYCNILRIYQIFYLIFLPILFVLFVFALSK